ncbi:AMP-binding protein [Acetobacteroides hydrogenigenes]|uniref:Fatty-acyl-CoA synthase n=1 Tax=Acetobacteroides hydrogenigenes TaxID=979970 RepID=A0A4R2EJJ9_9BACT|nr:AMP-binding protein [Acetobacteroides hydrogenigenes]TCN68495.1 fatty-acyl-CoA synthase [Acetobacteroides hydrogenigenes]
MALFSYAHGASETPLIGVPFGEYFRRIVKKHGDNEALVVVSQNYRATYKQLWDEVDAVAKSLIAYGIERGDRVGIWAPNRYEWVLVQIATARVGAIMVNINPGYRYADMKYAVEQSGIKLLIASSGFRKTSYIEMIDQLRADGSCPESVVVMENDWRTFIGKGCAITDQAIEERENTLQFDDPINIQYTSGTTGHPKGATLSHHNVLNNGFFIGERLEYTPKDRICIPVPFYHCFGMVLANMAAITHGATMVVPGEFFDPDTVMQTVQNEKCTSLYGVPTMFIAELEHPNFSKYDFSSLRTGIMAGSPCPIDTMQKVLTLMNMRDVQVCYGMTETSPVSTQTNAGDPTDKRVGSVGTVHPHVEIKIINPATNEIVRRGEEGEICTRGYSVMLGYWNSPEDTAKVIDQNRWMHTGDVGVMDDNGYVKIVGRIKDIIIRGGENISPREVEEFLIVHPNVIDAQVIGVPSERYGEEVCAWIIPREGSNITPEELVAYCKGNMATYKIPKYWKFVSEFPMTVTGKIRKVDMRKISTQELGLQKVSEIKTA